MTPIVFPTPDKRDMRDEVEALKRSLARAAAEDRRRLAEPPKPKPSTVAPGQGRPRRRAMETHLCQHPNRNIPGVKCLRPARTRDPIQHLPACWNHYMRAWRVIQAQKERRPSPQQPTSPGTSPPA